jgi:hypothetical protein
MHDTPGQANLLACTSELYDYLEQNSNAKSEAKFSGVFLCFFRISSPRMKLLAARCECLHLIKINSSGAGCTKGV